MNPRITVILFLIFLILVTHDHVLADVPVYSISAECDFVSNQVTFRPLVSYGQGDSSGVSADCWLAGGELVRIKANIFPLLPYGTNSGPVGWVSLWVNQAKVLSKSEFDCPDGETCDLMVKVSAKGMSLCRGTYEDIHVPPFKQFKKWKCSLTPRKKLSRTRDRIEFPSPKEPTPPEPGALVALYELSDKFCKLFTMQGSSSVPENGFVSALSMPEGYETPGSTNYGAGFDLLSFDMNNDGQDDKVIALHMRSHAEDSDTFYVYGSKPIPDAPQGLAHDSMESFYRLSAAYIVPDAWGRWPNHVSAPWWDLSDLPEFRTEYLYVWPFRWQGTTYFITGSSEVAKAHWHLILRPEPNNSVVTMCAFQVVQERY